jgi:hypothetical protein
MPDARKDAARNDSILLTVGRAKPDDWQASLRSKRRLPRYTRPAPPELAPDEVKQLATSGGLFRARDGKTKADVRRAANPSPRASFGFAGTCAKVTTTTLADGFLYLPVNGKDVAHLEQDLRLFRWDERRRERAKAMSWPGSPTAGTTSSSACRVIPRWPRQYASSAHCAVA